MKRLPAYLAALILGAAIYHFLAPRILQNPLAGKTPVFAPSLYLMATEQQRDRSADRLNNGLAGLAEMLSRGDTLTKEAAGQKVEELHSSFRSNVRQLNERRQKWTTQLQEMNEDKTLRRLETNFLINPPLPWPPPPPDPCDMGTCVARFLKDQLIVIYFQSPDSENVSVSFKNADGGTVLASEPGDASQVRLNSQYLKVSLDPASLESSDNFDMVIDGHLGDQMTLRSVIE